MDTQILLVNLSYIAAAILFVFGIKMLGHADTARKGNRISSIGMALAIIVTLLSQGLDYKLVLGGIAVGSVIGFITAKRVQMTGMPELVALFNGYLSKLSFFNLIPVIIYNSYICHRRCNSSSCRGVIFIFIAMA